MQNGNCSKYFPKSFQSSTTIDDEGYPKYKRRNNGLFVMKKEIQLDNKFVVPYNPRLLMRYQLHVNVEYCNKSNSIKYLFKYVNKGQIGPPLRYHIRHKMGNKLMRLNSFMTADISLHVRLFGRHLDLIYTIDGPLFKD